MDVSLNVKTSKTDESGELCSIDADILMNALIGRPGMRYVSNGGQCSGGPATVKDFMVTEDGRMIATTGVEDPDSNDWSSLISEARFVKGSSTVMIESLNQFMHVQLDEAGAQSITNELS